MSRITRDASTPFLSDEDEYKTHIAGRVYHCIVNKILTMSFSFVFFEKFLVNIEFAVKTKAGGPLRGARLLTINGISTYRPCLHRLP